MEIPIHNREAALERLGGDEELLRDILDMFLEDAPQQLEALTTALSSAEQDVVVRHAHSVKGSALNVGAEAIAATAAKIEIAARQGELADIEGLLAAVTEQIQALQHHLG